MNMIYRVIRAKLALVSSLLLVTSACGTSSARSAGSGPGSGASSGSGPGAGQVTLASLTANNTAACPSSSPLPAQCQAAFTGQTDTRTGVATPNFDPEAGNVSTDDIHAYLNNGASTKIFANLMLGFCVKAGSAYCDNNVTTGYNSNDTNTVAAQAEDLIRRHIDGAVMTWEGAGTREDSATLKFQAYVNANHCSGQSCNPMYLIMYDGPSMSYNVTSTGVPGTSGASCSGQTGANYENCVIAHIKNDMCYMNGMHFGNSAYFKVNGSPVVQVFPDEGVIPANGPAPSWADVWTWIEQWNNNLPQNCVVPGAGTQTYSANNGVPLVVFENNGGFSHVDSAGSYDWVHPAGTDPATDQFVTNIAPVSTAGTLDNFYATAQSYPGKQVWGAGFKGFNSSLAQWGQDRIMDQSCGQTWMQSLTASNQFYGNSTLPYLEIDTWNDYNEGTEIESGIDNCYTVSATVSGQTLSWSLNASSSLASVTTVAHIEIYDSTDGQTASLLATQPAALSGTYSLSGLPPGKHSLYVRMVGKNSILNRISSGVSYSH